MSINQRQYQHLTEMGISLWQPKSTGFQNASANQEHADTRYLKQTTESLSALTEQTFFTDLLLSLKLSIGEVTAQKDHLDLGLFNWFFYAKEGNELSIQCTDNKLISPSIELIRKSPVLKKQLWQTITTHLL